MHVEITFCKILCVRGSFFPPSLGNKKLNSLFLKIDIVCHETYYSKTR